MTKCIALGPGGTIGSAPLQDYRIGLNALSFQETGTPWVRFWADWPTLQPDGGLAPDDPASPGYGRWLGMLDQITQARERDGLKVILTPYRFPQWANGTDGMVLGSDADKAYRPWDRAVKNSRGVLGSLKELRFKLPEDLSPSGPWGRWVAFLIDALRPDRSDRAAHIDVLELVNEPNLQIWPQQGPSDTSDPFGSGPVTIANAVATMFRTGHAINAARGLPVMLAGPATQDGPASTRLQTVYDDFTAKLLDALDAEPGFDPGASFVWTHHNYRDVEEDRGIGSVSGQDNATGRIRARISGRWRGLGRPDGGAALWITEGGARISRMKTLYRPTKGPQVWPELSTLEEIAARVITRSVARLHTDSGDGAGVELVSNYLLYTDGGFDSGLRGFVNPDLSGGDPRPTYWAWRDLPADDPSAPGPLGRAATTDRWPIAAGGDLTR
jgi:hypothetical protein